MATVQVFSARQETQTWDEGIHLVAGYSYWKTGDMTYDSEHPPLGKYLDTLPLLLFHLDLPLEHHHSGDERQFGWDFLYRNRLPPDTILFAARVVTIALTALLGLLLAVWTRREFGGGTALLALLLYAFEPNIIAHGRYVTTDLIAALSIFLACIVWGKYLLSGRWTWLALSGVTFGLALVSKFSGVILVPAFLALYLIRWWQQPERHSIRHFALALLVVAVLGYAVVIVSYAPEARLFFPVAKHSGYRLLRDVVPKTNLVGDLLAWVGRVIRLPANSFFVGLGAVADHNQFGHNAYLLGMHSMKGWWYYFPVAWAVKSPLAILLAFVLVLALALARLIAIPAGSLVARLRQARFAWFVLLVPMLLYVGWSMASHINIGIRHLLPAFPFLLVLLAAGLTNLRWRFQKAAIALLSVAMAAESLAIYPNYLAFFNVLVGGPANGPHYLLDSNIDWGQDVKKLKAYMVANRIPSVCICYFGSAGLADYGVREKYLPMANETRQREKLDCVAAISVTPLYGMYVPPGGYDWLREKKPAARIGYSIYIYDLRKQPSLPSNSGAR